MGQIDLLRGKRIYLDTNVFIYAVEKAEPFVPACKLLFALVQSGAVSAVTSQLTLAECLVQPYRLGLLEQQQAFKRAMAHNPRLDYVALSESTLLLAARIRAKYSPKMPDAIHLAVAVQQQCNYFISNDKGIPSLPEFGLERLLLNDFVTV